MIEFWTRSNDTSLNNTEIARALQDPASMTLFVGYPPWLLYFAAICCTLFMLVGILGNLITVVGLWRGKKLHNATAVFIMNLSMSDLMFCCFNLPLAASTFWHRSWLHGPLLCRLFPLLRYGLVAVSIFTVLAIAVNRYVMIGHPKIYPKLYSSRYLTLMIFGTWIFAFAVLILTWFEKWGRFGLDLAIGSCSILPDANGRSPKEFLFVLAFLTPCTAIVICYARIFYIVRKASKNSGRDQAVTHDATETSFEHTVAEETINEPLTDQSFLTNVIADIPYADEFDDTVSEEIEEFFENRHKKKRSGSESASANRRKTHEKMATQASIVLEPIFWVKRLTSLENERLAPPRTPTSSISVTPEQGSKVRAFRRESKFRSFGRNRNDMSGRMTAKDRKLLKMILVIFLSFLACYLPITISKLFKASVDWRGFNIAGYILIYLTTCINPVIYVVMSAEYRSAYKNVLMCKSETVK